MRCSMNKESALREMKNDLHILNSQRLGFPNSFGKRCHFFFCFFVPGERTFEVQDKIIKLRGRLDVI